VMRLALHWCERRTQANIHILEPGAGSDERIEHIGEKVALVLEGTVELTLGDSRYLLPATYSRSRVIHRMGTVIRAIRPHGFSGSTPPQLTEDLQALNGFMRLKRW
jgi:hypothetical protein